MFRRVPRLRRVLLLPLAGVLWVLLPLGVQASVPRISLLPNQFEFIASPGDHLTGAVIFWNGTGTELPIQVGSADFRAQGEEGGVSVGEGIDPAHSLASWLHPSFESANVAPGERRDIPFIVDVPMSATPGSRWGALVVGTAPIVSDDGQLATANITANILVRIRGEAEERLAIESFGVERVGASSSVLFSARIRNTGAAIEKPKVSIELRNMFGSRVAFAPLTEANVLPGAVRRFETKTGYDLGLGRYTARLRVLYGTGQEITATARFWVVPKIVWWGLVVLVGVCGVVLGIKRFKSRALRSVDGPLVF